MKKLAMTAALVISAGIVLGAAGCASDVNAVLPDRQSWTVTSPDGGLQTQVAIDGDGGLIYTVKKDGVTVVDRSALGFTIAEDDLSLFTVESATTDRVSGSYDNISGKRSHVEYDCNQLTLTLKAWDFCLDVYMRSYDDGYAFRYGIRAIDGGEGTITVERENTEFAVPQGSTMWAQEYVSIDPAKGDFFAYEETFTRRQSTNNSGVTISMPMLYQVKGSDVYSLVTESGLIGSGYYGSYLKEAAGNEGTGIFQTIHSPAGVAYPDNVISYPFQSPWRVGITGSLKTVAESELVEKVYDDAEYWKPDNYDSLTSEEQEIYNYDWVDPGVAAWNWLIYTNGFGEKKSQNDYNLQREYVDLAAEMGWKYSVLDAGWNTNLNVADFKEFTTYAHDKGVKIIVWCNAMTDFANGDAGVLRAKLDLWASYGIDGIKIDFFDGQNTLNQTHQGEDIETIRWYETIYQETAKRKMVVNAHGSNKPTGERRIYPNVLNREAVRGNENVSVGTGLTINALFIRAVVGPSDFTPVVTPLSEYLTMGQQMALAVLFESGIPSMADYAETYQQIKINEFYRSIPSARDETVFLCGELDGYYCAAIRAGDEWFVAGANSIIESTVTIDFSFLEEGSYQAEYFNDDGEGSVVRRSMTVTSDSRQNVTMIANGGFVMRLQKI